MIVGLLGISDVVFGAALGVAWLLILAATIYRYRRDTLAEHKAALMTSGAAFWLAFSLIQLEPAVSGPPERLLGALTVACLIGGTAAGYRWWQTRGNPNS